jgi:hypothetical protein
MPPVKDVGEPGAGEPHARIDGRELETERSHVTAPAPTRPAPPRRLAPPVVVYSVRLKGCESDRMLSLPVAVTENWLPANGW